MSRSVYITARGLNNIVKKLRSFPNDLKQEVDSEFSAASADVVTYAKQNLRASRTGDEGKLHNSITNSKVGENWEVSVGVNYAPFVEFGTKKRFQPTRGFENYARQFHGQKVSGSSGSLDDAILGWVKRKKIRFEKAVSTTNYRTGRSKKPSTIKQRYLTPEQTAFVIARFISFHGVKAHPFLFPSFVKVRKVLTGNLVNIIRRAFK